MIWVQTMRKGLCFGTQLSSISNVDNLSELYNSKRLERQVFIDILRIHFVSSASKHLTFNILDDHFMVF